MCRGYQLQFIKCDCCSSDTCKQSIIRNHISWKKRHIVNQNQRHSSQVGEFILGSFDQSHTKFGEKRDLQSAAIALYSIAFSCIKKATTWTNETIDSLLDYGNKCYDSPKINRRPYSGDLPETVYFIRYKN